MVDLKNHSDEELVKLYKTGINKAFQELYFRFEPKLKKLIYFYVNNADDVEDIFHNTIMRVLKHIDSFNVEKNFSAWIYQIAVNCSKNFLQKTRKSIELFEKEKFRVKDTAENVESPEENIINQHDIAEFNRAVEAMDDKFRDVFISRFDHKMKYSEISGVLRCSERTAKWRMKKAIEKITYYLKERDII